MVQSSESQNCDLLDVLKTILDGRRHALANSWRTLRQCARPSGASDTHRLAVLALVMCMMRFVHDEQKTILERQHCCNRFTSTPTQPPVCVI
jgi:hypothetical protein